MDNNSIILLVVAIAGGLFLIWMILYFIPIGLWFQALVSDVKISLLQLVLMRWRKVPPSVIVGAMIEGKKPGWNSTGTCWKPTIWLADMYPRSYMPWSLRPKPTST